MKQDRTPEPAAEQPVTDTPEVWRETGYGHACDHQPEWDRLSDINELCRQAEDRLY